jgi:hypothetical protein
VLYLRPNYHIGGTPVRAPPFSCEQNANWLLASTPLIAAAMTIMGLALTTYNRNWQSITVAFRQFIVVVN